MAGRTETTIKLANVSRQSAEEVSSQMTAIWNNFDDGSKSLEYYADVITALGANTAASSEEIARGMSKFAAVAETVGLSYEYASSALATIVATTRQSEDTVGTGLRTIFSRLEGLKLGETLEDGVDLNKYSAALDTIGVRILDANGNLKQMDDILDETAARWDNLD
ncbi:MAG: phage tail tape measure protein [Bacillota bacterium]|nr:phage tail tape measure protein [Bacillota bacterium]